ncbi:MAG: fumarylacetoacetate hydrolase family protein [Deltaproteobacteria bacterium]|nr:fumarylacetoacetate hydrolase family protein [Deltaproteobacteria bacterium]
MKFIRFEKYGQLCQGLLTGSEVQRITGDMFTEHTIGKECFRLDEVNLQPPCMPSKIIAVGLNYRGHAREMNMAIPGEPLLFLKPATAVIGPGAPIIYPKMSQRVDYEGELGVVIGRRCRDVSGQQAPDYVFGYTCLNDVTARDLQQKDGQFTRAKGFDTFCPIGPCIETELDPAAARIETRLNGELRQETSTADFIFPVYRLVSFISQVMTLLPGDVIATGTPSGIGPMQPGDEVEVRIRGIGLLQNTVAG